MYTCSFLCSLGQIFKISCLPKCTQSQGKENSMEDTKGLVIAVTQVLFEIDNFNITIGLILLIDVFFVNYPSLSPACI